MQLNEDIGYIEPGNGLVYGNNTWFECAIYFNKQIENVTIDVQIDDNPVDENFILLEETDEQKYWKHHKGDPAFTTSIKSGKGLVAKDTYWKLSWKHWFKVIPMVEFLVNYDTDTETGKQFKFIINKG